MLHSWALYPTIVKKNSTDDLSWGITIWYMMLWSVKPSFLDQGLPTGKCNFLLPSLKPSIWKTFDYREYKLNSKSQGQIKYSYFLPLSIKQTSPVFLFSAINVIVKYQNWNENIQPKDMCLNHPCDCYISYKELYSLRWNYLPFSVPFSIKVIDHGINLESFVLRYFCCSYEIAHELFELPYQKLIFLE